MIFAIQISEIQTPDSAGNIQDMAVLQEIGTDNVFCIHSSYLEQEVDMVTSPYNHQPVIVVDPSDDSCVREIQAWELNPFNLSYELLDKLVMTKTGFTGILHNVEVSGEKVFLQLIDEGDECKSFEYEEIDYFVFNYLKKFPQLFN